MKEKSNGKSSEVSRRAFLKTSAVATASLAALTAGTSRIYAAGSDKFRIGIIGCGGRGNGAVSNCLAAAKHIGVDMEVVAAADWFKDKAVRLGKRNGVPEERCFEGPHGYKRVLETDVNLVLLATSPCFRPVHLEAAIKAGKNVFSEKPVAVDPPGCRKYIQAGELAKQKGLAIVAGTQRRHEERYLKNQHAVSHGAIGKIVGGCVWWCGNVPWVRWRDSSQSNADYLVNNWLNFVEMSGDHITEQHVHNLDVANWFIGHPPVTANGFGGRARRVSGNSFDFFSIDYDYGDDCHIHSMCRQIKGCYNRVSEFFEGTEGSTSGGGKMNLYTNKSIITPDFPEQGGPYVQEHIDLIN
ncbi:MAG: Gfo/Idh/MocA family oxidoreductase, partial [Planctomycetes bacterium]|nr:Gfo/Idh/MocA family oxidoreductase [Planctomycetota bacterium]